MLYSMTGFGKFQKDFPNVHIRVEIRSLNSKTMDINLRMPSSFKQNEISLRKTIAQKLGRGKVDVSISLEYVQEHMPNSIDVKLAKKYYTELQNLSQQLGIDSPHILSDIMKMPHIFRGKKEDIDQQVWDNIIHVVNLSMEELIASRKREGHLLAKDIKEQVHLIDCLTEQIEVIDGKQTERIKDRLSTHLSSLKNIDSNRLEQEMIYYIEKLDISEEKLRLQSHGTYFLSTINESIPMKGKKLGFITQEMGREINTIGSKANDATIQRIVVEMKEALEKIKEQVLNIL